MALQAPNLDDRKFQDIVSEARRKIPLYCPKWTDYNLSDPGMTLIELFAWMVDMLLYRVNRVPEKNYIKFMDLLGIRLEPSQPARVDVTFRLSAPQPQAIVIPKGTEVATVRTETEEAITFTTDEDLPIIKPILAYALTTIDDINYNDCMVSLKSWDRQIPVFNTIPEENDAIYFGFENNLNALTLILTIDANIEGIGVDPHDPPLAWEYWDGIQEKWLSVRLDLDTTGGLNTYGDVILHIPHSGAPREINDQKAFWIRCRATKPHAGQRAYSSSPKIKSITVDSIGGTVPASHCMRAARELLGRSNGSPGQKFYLRNIPVLPREREETIEVEGEKEGTYERWQEVTDFADSRPGDRHFTLDSVSGEIQFGPLIRQPSGEERQYGKIPPLNRQIRFTSYRTGGGVIGNVGKGTITVLKSSIPYVASVTNFQAATGGRDAETLEAAMMRAPRILRNQTRAVTADDFEYLALEASPQVARAKCLAAGTNTDGQTIPPGVVRLLLVPKVEDLDGPIPKEKLDLLPSVRSEVQEYLDERRLLAMRVEVAAPEYQQVSIEAKVRAKPTYDFEQIEAAVKRKLYEYINPVRGGPKGQGWPFGRGLFPSEVSSVIQSTPDVDYIENVKIYLVDRETGQKQPIENKINIPANGLICSGEHHVEVIPTEGYE